MRFRGGGLLSVGIETTTPRREYSWDGLNRGGDSHHPIWLFQYTMEGHGLFRTGRKTRTVPPGHAFCAHIPSAHSYEGDPTCPEWKFFWLMIRDEHITSRLLKHPNLVNRVPALGPDSPVVRSAATLLSKLLRGDALDSYAMEELLFRWMLECERWADQARHPVRPKTRLLESVRRHVLANLLAPVRTSALAAASGLSRSNFSHLFRKTTGHTPAAYVQELRLDEAARLLRSGELSIKEIASQTGFTSSNHLCKSFRRSFRMSPGDFRRLHRA
jgi:AraC-like DNA-binding protein